MPEDAVEGEVVQDLRIPRAIFRPHEGGEERIVTPAQVRREGLQYQPGLFLCPYCRERVDARVEGDRRVSYFAHHEGSGLDCERRSDGGWEYATQTKASWERELESRNRSHHFAITLIPRRADVLLVGTGPVLSSTDFAKLPTELRVASAGLEGTITKSQFSWTRPSFQVKITDPITASVAVNGPSFSATWRAQLSQAERNLQFAAFISADSGPAVQAADATDVPRSAWFVYRGADQTLVEILKTHGLHINSSVAHTFKVAGAPDWTALHLPWEAGAAGVRRALRNLGIVVGSRQRAMSVLPLTGEAVGSGDSTFVYAPEGRARLLVKPEGLSQVLVDLVPLPYHAEFVKRQELKENGCLLDIELDDGQQVGEFYLLGLDPRDQAKFVQEHRVTIARDARALDRDEAVEFGVRVRSPGSSFVLSPFEHGEIILQFKELGPEGIVNVDLAAPLREADEQRVFPTVEVRAYDTLNADATPVMRQTVSEPGEFDHVVRLITGDPSWVAFGIQFDRLGEVRVVSAEAAAAYDRPRVRVELANALWSTYSPHKLSASARRELVAKHVPDAGRSYGWDSEINGIHKLLRRFGGRTAQSAQAITEHLKEKGCEPHFGLLSLPLEQEEAL